MSDFIEKMVALANGVHSDLVALPNDHARYVLVKQIIDNAEVVFAVWTDRFAQDGVGDMLVKGQGRRLRVRPLPTRWRFRPAWQPFPATAQSS